MSFCLHRAAATCMGLDRILPHCIREGNTMSPCRSIWGQRSLRNPYCKTSSPERPLEGGEFQRSLDHPWIDTDLIQDFSVPLWLGHWTHLLDCPKSSWKGMDGMLSWLFLENNYMMKFIETYLPSVDVDGRPLMELVGGRPRALAQVYSIPKFLLFPWCVHSLSSLVPARPSSPRE